MSGLTGKRSGLAVGIAAYCLLIVCVAGVLVPSLAQLAA